VHETLSTLRRAGCRIALNLLTFPGVSDDEAEIAALEAAVARHKVDQVQLRSLNLDPLWLLRRLPRQTRGIGVEAMLRRLEDRFEWLGLGNFTMPATAGR
jgi:pyruvate-formate lyase-activating enzyme